MENRSRVTLYKDYRGKIASIQEFSFVAEESKFRHEAKKPKSSKQEELEALMSKKEEKEAKEKAKEQRKALKREEKKNRPFWTKRKILFILIASIVLVAIGVVLLAYFTGV